MTSRACTESSGTSLRCPDRASSSIWRLTTHTHCRDTLKVWSFPSPGRVTSRSTCRGGGREGGRRRERGGEWKLVGGQVTEID